MVTLTWLLILSWQGWEFYQRAREWWLMRQWKKEIHGEPLLPHQGEQEGQVYEVREAGDRWQGASSIHPRGVAARGRAR